QGPAGASAQSYLLTDQNLSLTGTHLLVPGITADIVADGAVLVYFRDTNSTGPWYSLPYEQPGVTISLLDFGVGYIDINSNVNETGVDIRVVIIPAATVNSIV